MNSPFMEEPFVFLGERCLSGVYLLHIHLAEAQRITFGRFNHGEPVNCLAGEYLYLGSARNKTLASRLLRHMRRSGDQPPQDLYDQFELALLDADFPISERTPAPKRLHWHIDYLLDKPHTQIRHVVVVRSEGKLEAILGRWLVAQAGTQVVAEGLGASDVRGGTHLLRVEGVTRKILNEFTHYLETIGY